LIPRVKTIYNTDAYLPLIDECEIEFRYKLKR
jgi:hypothetical protein